MGARLRARLRPARGAAAHPGAFFQHDLGGRHLPAAARRLRPEGARHRPRQPGDPLCEQAGPHRRLRRGDKPAGQDLPRPAARPFAEMRKLRHGRHGKRGLFGGDPL